jgi:universal stress protein A
MEFKNILVPIDFSSSSLCALELACQLADQNGSTLHLFHSYPVFPPIVAPYAPAVPLDYLNQVRDAAKAHLHEWREKHCNGVAEVIEHTDCTSPSIGIVELADELDVDLIVMGTRGTTGLKHVLLGSVAERVVRTAHCPVLTLKGES